MRERFPVFDLHCDTATELYDRGQDWNKNELQLDLERASELLRHIQVYAFCCVYDRQFQPLTRRETEQRFVSAVSHFYSALLEHGQTHALCRSAQDMAHAAAEGKHSVFLSLEGPEAINCDPGRLEELKEIGVVMTTLTWNYSNELAGCHGTDDGLSSKGKAFVRRAQELGIVIDVSHLSEKAFWDLCKITTAPIIASHSNSRAVCDHTRNLTDLQFKTICNLDGLVGINLYSPFLKTEGRADMSDVKRHIDHFLSLGGQHHIALGGDLDGCDTLPVGFTGINSYNTLGRYLVQKGLEEELTMNIMNNNAVRFFLQHLQTGPIA